MQLTKFSIAAILLLTCNALFSQTVISGELRKWHNITLTFNGPNTSESNNTNPFLDYRLNVTFTGPNGKSYLVPGFYAADGNAANTGANSGNKWQVHFSPDQTGSWTYTTSFRTGTDVAINLNASAGSPTSFNGASGNFNISNNNKSLPDNRANGRLSYVGERYLKYKETGNYFIKAGADSPENLLAYGEFDNSLNSKTWGPHLRDWINGNPTWMNDKGKGLIGAVNYLASKGMNAFSFLTMNVTGDGKDVWPWSAVNNSDLDGNSGTDPDNRTRYDVSKLAQWEILFSHADSKGMYLHFKTQETENDLLMDGGELGTERKLYYRELIARFGHHLALNWNLGEENDIYDADELNDTNCSRVKSYADYFQALDPYNHHVVIHSYPWGQDLLYTPLLGNTGLTGASIQSDINTVHEDVKKWIQASNNRGKKWVVANDEQGGANKGVTTDASYSGIKGSQADNQKDVRNKVLWGTLLAGGAGVEYYFGYQTGETDLTTDDWRSRDKKWDDAKIAVNFFQQYLPYWQMESSDNSTSSSVDYCLSKTNEIYALYLPNGGSTNVNLSSASGKFSVQWFDPRNGGNLLNGSITEINAGANRSIGNPPNNATQDWVALVKKQGGSTGGDTPSPTCEADYESKNGLVVIEGESLSVPSGWNKKTAVTGYTGTGYLEWEGGDSFNNPGTGIISTTIKINEAGDYLFEWRSKVGQGTDSSEFNDSWLRFPDASDFYAQRGTHIVYPKGSGKLPSPNGVGSNGWFKVYLGGTTNWTWSSSTSDDDPHKIYVSFDSPGVYTMEISGRSDHHLIDRITLNKSTVDASNLSLPETPCTDTPNSDVAVTSVAVSPEIANLNIGGTLNLNLQVSPSNATDKSVVWTSSNTNIATVNQSGNVTAKAAGTVTITVKSVDGNHTDTAALTITNADIPVTGVTVSPDQATIETGSTLILNVQVAPANATNKSLVWTSSNTNIATVNQSGNVTAKAAGTVTITVKSVDGNHTDTAALTITNADIPVTGVTVSPDQATIETGSTLILNVQVAPANATNKSLVWTSSNTNIATVNQSGNVTAKAAGTVTITVKSVDGNHTDTAALTITNADIPVTGVAVSPDQATIETGSTLILNVQVAPANATNKSLVWTSSDTSIATVNQNGNVSSRAEGVVSITVRSVDGNFTDTASLTIANADIPVSQVIVSPKQSTIETGSILNLNVEVLPSDATNKAVVWKSSNTLTATVNQNGRISALSAGTVQISASSVEGDFSDTATITIVNPDIPVTGVAVSPDQATIETGSTLILNVQVAPANATNKSLVWTSSDTGIATVNQNGNVSSRAEGVVSITVRSVDGNFTDTASLTIANANIPVSQVNVSPKQSTIETGSILKLNVEVLPSDATNKAVVWKSSNTLMATVNQNGRISARSAGTVQISALSVEGDFSDTATITIVDPDIPVSGVTVSPKQAAIEVGNTLMLLVDVLPSNASNLEVVWNSSDTSIATVNQDGRVSAIAEGNVSITVKSSDGGFEDTATLSVVIGEIPLTALSVSPKETSLDVGTSLILNVDLTPANTTNSEVIWSSSDTGIARVNQNGRVTALAEGQVIITVSSVVGDLQDTAILTIAGIDTPVASITISPKKSSLEIGNSLDLNAEILPVNATNTDIVWTSSDTAVAIVDQDGTVTAVGSGTVNITVSTDDGGFADIATLSVEIGEIPLTALSVSPKETSLDVGASLILSADLTPANTTNSDVIWSSSDAGIARVNQNGWVTALAEGQVIITVSSVVGDLQDTAILTVAGIDTPVASITISPKISSLEIGNSLDLNAEILPVNATNTDIVWSSSDTAVAIVDQDGTVTAVGSGTVNITVSTVDGGFADIAIISVVRAEIPVESLAITPDQASLEIGETLSMELSVLPFDATHPSIIWSSSDVSVASVDQDGTVTALSEGTVTITASLPQGDITATATLILVASPEPTTPPGPEPTPDEEADCSSDYISKDNKIIIEAENLNVTFGWAVNSAIPGYSGGGYIEYQGEDQFDTPGTGLIATSIEIKEAGTYLFQWRNKIGSGSNPTESNDSWLRFPDADDFFGLKEDGTMVYPKGEGKNPSAKGASSDGWFKVYQNTGSEWNWTTHTSDRDAHRIFVQFDKPGVYTMEISGRSKGHILDRIVLSRDETGATDLMLEETPCGSPPIAMAPSLRIENGSAAEGNAIEFIVSLSRASAETIVLNLGFLDETADRHDYDGQAVTVTFKPGETSKILSVPTHNDRELEGNEMFYVGVSALLAGTLTDYYDRAELTILDEDAPIRIYPNPATANMVVQLSGILKGSYQLGVYSISGELVQQQNSTIDGTFPFKLTNMAKGIYILRAIGNEHSFNGKLIVRN